jgi:hypothetical protein
MGKKQNNKISKLVRLFCFLKDLLFLYQCMLEEVIDTITLKISVSTHKLH